MHEFGPPAPCYCVAVFVINEGSRILAQLDLMVPDADTLDIVIADGGSTDGSLVDSLLVPRRVNTLLVKTGPGRLSAQKRMAMAFAMDRGYDGIVTIDGNNKDDPSTLPAFMEALDRGIDDVQGSRFVPGGRAVHTPLSRLLGIRLLHAPLISSAAGVRYTDTTNGFRAYSRRFLLDPQGCTVSRGVFTLRAPLLPGDSRWGVGLPGRGGSRDARLSAHWPHPVQDLTHQGQRRRFAHPVSSVAASVRPAATINIISLNSPMMSSALVGATGFRRTQPAAAALVR